MGKPVLRDVVVVPEVAASQQYFSLRTNQPPATSQRYFSLRTNQHQLSATSQTNGVIHDEPVPASSQPRRP
jgi:hypothetical protein